MRIPFEVLGEWRARRRDARVEFDHDLAVCAIFKNEARYLSEWLTFHLGVGVDHFYLYNDSSEDDFQAVLDPWIDRHLVTMVDWPQNKGQVEAYNHCVRAHRNRARWIAFIDLDEFLFSPSGHPLPDVLVDYSDVSAIFVYWVLFGSSGHERPPDGHVIESFTRCLDRHDALNDTFDHGKVKDRTNYVTGWSRDGKSIVNPRRVRYQNVHRPKSLWFGEVVDERRRPAMPRHPACDLSYSALRINHYWAKSIQDLQAKVERGSIANRRRPPRNLDRWLARERMLNGSEDRSILPIWRRIKDHSEFMA